MAYDDLSAGLLAEMERDGLDPRTVYAMVVTALEEDLPAGSDDVTSAATIPSEARGTADLAARADGVVAGLAIAELVFHYVLGREVSVDRRVPDGSHVSAGDVVLTVSGPVRGLLTAERTALNFAGHLSGVATATAAWVAALEGTRARVLDTRKTLPGWRGLQKYAVRCGGGGNHRFSLSDMALVKDNHVLAAGCDRVLLDDMDDRQLAEAVRLTAGRATLEASGGLTVDRAREVAATGVDLISVGALTHSVTVLDLGMDLRPVAP